MFRPRRAGDFLVDIAVVGLAAVLTIGVVGLALDSPIVAPAYNIPLLGPLLGGVRAFWQHVYDPQTV